MNSTIGGVYVGCATDRKFVDPTCAMLSSLADNASLPEAIVMVADFGLNESDRMLLRDSAGPLGSTMQFVPIDRKSPKIVALPAFDFPLPLIGRLILPREITEPRSRLLLVDSDMVVNHSLRPLFEMNMMGRPLAAAQDPLMMIEYRHHRKHSPVYFNAGLMLVDIDRFNALSVGEAAMAKLASYEQRPIYLDQCALNDVLNGNWLELNRRWNFFQTGYDQHFARHDYDAAHIIHFAGPKPWEVDFHPATPVWNHHATQAQRRSTAWRLKVDAQPVDASFLAMQYEVLLGRELETDAIIAERTAWSASQATAVVIASDEFRRDILTPLIEGVAFQSHRFHYPLTRGYRAWVADRLPILPSTVAAIVGASSWREMLALLVSDARLMQLAGLEIFAIVPPAKEPKTPVEASRRGSLFSRVRSSGGPRTRQ